MRMKRRKGPKSDESKRSHHYPFYYLNNMMRSKNPGQVVCLLVALCAMDVVSIRPSPAAERPALPKDTLAVATLRGLERITLSPPDSTRDVLWVGSIPLGADVYIWPGRLPADASRVFREGRRVGSTPYEAVVEPGQYAVGVLLPAEPRFANAGIDTARGLPYRRWPGIEVTRGDSLGRYAAFGQVFPVYKSPKGPLTVNAVFCPNTLPYTACFLLAFDDRDNFRFDAWGVRIALERGSALIPSEQEEFLRLLRWGGSAGIDDSTGATILASVFGPHNHLVTRIPPSGGRPLGLLSPPEGRLGPPQAR